jgi:two-component system chemotaxis sensor kinase CheA
MDDLLQEFIAETRETLEAVSGEIVGWEADPADRARLDAIFRFVHTIKGSCGFLDLPRLARLSHAAEDALAAVRDGARVPDAALVSAILAIVDRIAALVEAIDSGDGLDGGDEEALIAALAGGPAAAAPASPQPARPAARRSVRLSLDLLDRMMGGVSDLVLARNQLARHVRAADDPQAEALLERLTLTVDELRDSVTRSRMQRIEALFSPLPRLVRDTAAAVGKTVTLTIAGGDVELDREMIELLRDPLVHLVRNAIDHGLEGRADRVMAGKPVAGELRVSARQMGNLIAIEIADDGRGVDTAALVAKTGRADPSRAVALAALDEAGRLELMFEPGLSSREEATDLSGRGVGMDVVKANVEQIGGRIGLRNVPGRGLTVTIEVPLTLAILNALLVEAAGTRFALRRSDVEELVAADARDVRIERFGAAAIATVRGRRLPLVELDRLVGRAPDGPPQLVAIVSPSNGTYAIALDAVCDMQELVVKPAAPAVMRAGLYGGQMLPDDGAPVLLLDCVAIAARAGLQLERQALVPVQAPAPEAPRALLFEDVDGARRLVALDAVDRIERVAPGAVRAVAGALWLTAEGRSVPVWNAHDVGADAVAAVLRIQLDGREIAYPVRAACEIVAMPADATPFVRGAVGAVAVIEGAPVEILDPLLLLATDHAVDATRPLCLLHGSESAWMEAFLKPTVEAAGYRVVRALAPAERAAVALAMEEDAESAPAPAIRLSRTPAGGLYRYDRAALVAALTGHAA